MTNNIKFTIPLPSPMTSLNKTLRMNRFALNKLNTDFYADVYVLIRSNFQERVPNWGKVRVSATIHSKRRTDKDNRVSVMKALCDGIVHAELVDNDDERFMEYEFPKWVEKKDGEPEISVEIEKI